LNSAMFTIIFVTNHVLRKQFENFLSNPCICVCVFLRVTEREITLVSICRSRVLILRIYCPCAPFEIYCCFVT